MVRHYKRKTQRGSYGTDNLKKTIEEVNNGVSLRLASRQNGVPVRTLRRHRDKKVSYPGDIRLRNTSTALPEHIEKQLHEHIQFMEKRLFGLSMDDIKCLAFRIAEVSNLPNPFNKE